MSDSLIHITLGNIKEQIAEKKLVPLYVVGQKEKTVLAVSDWQSIS
jgi:hypothetical protein